jgi:hypothetical protein
MDSDSLSVPEAAIAKAATERIGALFPQLSDGMKG